MLWDYNTSNQAGLAGPQATAQTSAPASSGAWYDQSKQWNAADPVSGALPLKGLKYYPAETKMERNSGGDYEQVTIPAYAVSSNGTKLELKQNADGTMSFRDTYQDPAGASVKDKMDVDYTFDPKTGVAIPTNAVHRYQASDWVDKGQSIATLVGAMATAYLGGTALAGASAGGGTGAAAAGAGGTGVAGGSAATGNMALIESGLGTAGYGGAGAANVTGGLAAGAGGAAEGLSGMDLAADAAAGTGNNVAAAGQGLSAAQTSTLSQMASKAGTSLTEFLKTPAGQKAAIMLATTAVGAATAPNGPTPGSSSGGGTTVGGIAGKQEGLADSLAARNTALQQQYDPLYAQLIQSNLGQQSQNADLSKSLIDSYKTDFAPLATKMATTAANYDTAERRQEAADAAIAGVGQQYTAARRTLNSNLASTGSGVDPSSGLAQSLNAASRLEEAKASAGAGTTARKNVETTGIGLVKDAANFGLSQANTGLSASSASTAAGNNAAGLAQQQQNQGNANATTVSGLFSNAVNSTGVKANIDNGVFNQQQTAYNNDNAKTADYLSAAGQIAGYIWSSKKGGGLSDARRGA